MRPILASRCFACHGPDSASRKAELRLDQREAAIDADALVPGDAQASEIINRILSEDPETLMPPPEIQKPLTKEEKATLVDWVESGADYEPHWSLIPPERPVPPDVPNPEVGARTRSIDSFKPD